ncbi:MAG: RHS repeat protein [Myxococcales bacterium]|nr:RHS repeat protein [Myxococcales bacterium]
MTESLTTTTSQTTTYARDGMWRPTQVTHPDNNAVVQTWDDNGNLTSLTPPGKPAHTFGYDDLDRRTSYDPPDLDPAPNQFRTLWAMDADRRLDNLTDPTCASEGLCE